MVRDTLGVLVKWGFIIAAVGALLGGATMAVEWTKTYGGVVGMSLGAMKEGVGSLVDGWNLTTEGGITPAPEPTTEPTP